MDKNASPFATQEQILALLARPVREVTITKDETPLETVLAVGATVGVRLPRRHCRALPR